MSDFITNAELRIEAERLCDENDQFKAENAKLREQVERLRTQLADVTESVGRVEERCAKTFEVGKRWMAKAARFEAENAKLRELVRDVWHLFTEHGAVNPCDLPVVDAVRDQMRELGVEVD